MPNHDDNLPPDEANDRGSKSPTDSFTPWGGADDAPRAQPTESIVKPGDRIARHELLECIGAGGMGQVWVARHPKLPSKRVAIKLILKDPYRDSEPDAAPWEARRLARLRHDHIVRVEDAGVHVSADGRELPYVIMEYLPGALAITEYAAKHDLDVRTRLRLFLDVCGAVAYVHDHGDLHLDIKPTNVLVDSNGKAFLADFGIARPVLDWFRAVVGTPGFMGPEHLDGDVDLIDKQSDVWSLGSVLYWMLAQTDPYGLPRKPPRLVRRRAIADPPLPMIDAAPSLRRTAPGLHLDLEQIVRKAMDPDPQLRFDDAGALRATLTAAVAKKGPRRRFDAFRVQRPGRWAAVVLTAIVALATVLGFVLTDPVVKRWTGLRTWYGNWLPVPVSSRVAVDPLPDVVILGFDTGTARSLADEDGLESVIPEVRTTYRQMHAEAIPRLVDAGVHVIVFDLYFPPPKAPFAAFDPGFAAAIEAARAAGTMVIVGWNRWKTVDGRPEMSPAIYDAGPLWGGLSVAPTANGKYYAADLLMELPDEAPIPGLALAAFSAYLQPGAYHRYEFEDEHIRVEHLKATRATPEAVVTVGEHPVRPFARLPVTGNVAGTEEGALASISVHTPPSPDVIDQARMPYADVWALSADDLGRRLRNKVVVIADLDNDARLSGSETLPPTRGHVIHAMAIQSLILASGPRMSRLANIPLTILGAAIGAILLWWMLLHTATLPGSVVRRGVGVGAGVVVAAAVLFAIAWATHWFSGNWLHPMPGVMAALLAGVFVAVIGPELARGIRAARAARAA